MKVMFIAYGGAMFGGVATFLATEQFIIAIFMFLTGGCMIALATFFHFKEKEQIEEEKEKRRTRQEAEKELYDLWPLLWEIDRNYHEQMLNIYYPGRDYEKVVKITLPEIALRMKSLGNITTELFDEISSMHHKAQRNMENATNRDEAWDIMTEVTRPLAFRIEGRMKELRGIAYGKE